MLENILYGFGVMVLCLFLQSLLFVSVIIFYNKHLGWVKMPGFGPRLILINGVMLLLVIGNLLQISMWAILFQHLDEFATYHEAFYHSAVNFSTLGYGDIVMSADRRLLGPLESINGVIMIGVSTAVLMAAIQDTIKKSLSIINKKV